MFGPQAGPTYPGEGGEAFNPAGGEAETVEPAVSENEFNDVHEILRNISHYSIRELKEKLNIYKDKSIFLEKNEMKKKLCEILLSKCKDDELLILVIEFNLHKEKDFENLERRDITDILIDALVYARL
jgi:predicted DNA-binding protein YlxM (UPF0122 family)